MKFPTRCLNKDEIGVPSVLWLNLTFRGCAIDVNDLWSDRDLLVTLVGCNMDSPSRISTPTCPTALGQWCPIQEEGKKRKLSKKCWAGLSCHNCLEERGPWCHFVTKSISDQLLWAERLFSHVYAPLSHFIWAVSEPTEGGILKHDHSSHATKHNMLTNLGHVLVEFLSMCAS